MTSISAQRFDELVPVDYPGEWDLGGLGSPEYAEFLRGWLTARTGTDRWYRAGPLDEDRWPELRAKVKSIVNEHLLSVGLRKSGVRISGLGRAASVLPWPPRVRA